MANLLGWKDILRPIRDGYRHLFPTPDTGPTPEERRKQRQKDWIKGFAYFDTFEQLKVWSEADSEPLQRANTPLLQRPLRMSESEVDRSSVTLIHDYAGNYHDYEIVQEIGMRTEMYACEYLQFVDTFIYFSHKLVCVPPSTWTNTLHRNGVLSLGTILIEPQTADSEELLQSKRDESGKTFPLASILGAIPKHYGFDGWLLNIEKPFPKDCWDANTLSLFCRQLREELGVGKRLIWCVLRCCPPLYSCNKSFRYDALTTANTISYQNALTANNLLFAKSCGYILTNYSWTEDGAESSKRLALREESPLKNVLFGIDLWAQNTTKLTQPRITYPEKGGGGTNTGVAVSKLAELGFSAGLFAPAWSFEHFPYHGRAVERVVWEGVALPQDIDCSCGNSGTRHHTNKENAVIKTAREFPAGSESFFFTDFNRAFIQYDDDRPSSRSEGNNIHPQIGAQSILPRPSTDMGQRNKDILSCLETRQGRTRLVIKARHNASSAITESTDARLPLYKLSMPANPALGIKISCRSLLREGSEFSVSCYVKVGDKIRLLPIPDNDGLQELALNFNGPLRNDSISYLQEFGVQFSSRGIRRTEELCLLEVFQICISPRSTLQESHSNEISHIRIEQREMDENKYWRLCWNYEEGTDSAQSIERVPYSRITGPFSYFDIRVGEVRLGRAYALEHPITQEMIEQFAHQEIEVDIRGVGFDGQTLAHARSKVVM